MFTRSMKSNGLTKYRLTVSADTALIQTQAKIAILAAKIGHHSFP